MITPPDWSENFGLTVIVIYVGDYFVKDCVLLCWFSDNLRKTVTRANFERYPVDSYHQISLHQHQGVWFLCNRTHPADDQ